MYFEHDLVDSSPQETRACRIVTMERLVIIVADWLQQIYACYKMWWLKAYVIAQITKLESSMARSFENRVISMTY